jgi:hypothetical protein
MNFFRSPEQYALENVSLLLVLHAETIFIFCQRIEEQK